MDFNLKSSWAGNIYHHFESMCQDVDGLVNKDNVKFVGDQVQNVGFSVLRLYSNIVQDKFQLSADTEKQRKQPAAAEQCDIPERISVTGIRTTSSCTDEEQLPKNLILDDHKVQISELVNNEESQTFQLLRDGSTTVQNSEVISSAEENVAKDLKPATADSCFDCEMLSTKSDESYKSFSPESSAYEEDSTSIGKERRDCCDKKGDESFSDDTLSEKKLAVVEDPYSDENESLSSLKPTVSTNEVYEDNCQPMDSPLPPPCDADSAFEKDGVLCESVFSKDESVNLSTSDHSSKHASSYNFYSGKEEIAITPSTYCTSPKSWETMESTSENVSKEAEKVLSCSLFDGCTDNNSAASPTNAVDLFFPIFKSNDNRTLQTDMSEFVTTSSENRHEEHYEDGLSEIALSPSETGNTYKLNVPIDDLDLESVDLSSNVKCDESFVTSSKLALPGSYRRKDLRYYKNLIQSAFTCKKRLSKEYEHLAIMYGDIDVELSPHFEPSSLSSFPNTAESSEEMNEWELL